MLSFFQHFLMQRQRQSKAQIFPNGQPWDDRFVAFERFTFHEKPNPSVNTCKSCCQVFFCNRGTRVCSYSAMYCLNTASMQVFVGRAKSYTSNHKHNSMVLGHHWYLLDPFFVGKGCAWKNCWRKFFLSLMIRKMLRTSLSRYRNHFFFCKRTYSSPFKNTYQFQLFIPNTISIARSSNKKLVSCLESLHFHLRFDLWRSRPQH